MKADCLLPLPPYPATGDAFSRIQSNGRPIVVYGMGNGADKLVARLEARGLSVSDYFASDGFVRGHSFRGKRVLSFQEVREKYADFQIVLAFATHRDEVLSMLYDMAEQYPLIMPDLPVSGDGTFDAAFYNTHYGEIKDAYDALCDAPSKNLFASVLYFKLTGDIRYLREFTVSPAACYEGFDKSRLRLAVDAGAYTGDTVREILRIIPTLSHIYGIEADKKNFKKLLRYAETEEPIRLFPIHAAVFRESGSAAFSVSGNRNATLLSGSYQSKSEEVQLLAIDDISFPKPVDYIKYDVEGVEADALLGSRKTILRDRPVLSISVYHRNEDIFALQALIASFTPGYRYYLKRTPSLPAWEIRLIAIPEEKEREV